jgi:hypothetical protein
VASAYYDHIVFRVAHIFNSTAVMLKDFQS